MPRGASEMIVGYDAINKTVILLGGTNTGSNAKQQRVTFKDSTFIDQGRKYSVQSFWASAQSYSQNGNQLYVIQNADTILTIDLTTRDLINPNFDKITNNVLS